MGIASTQPSAKTDIVGICFERGDTNWSFIHNDSSGTATKVDLGASFAVTAKEMLVFEVSTIPNSGTIYYKVTNLTSGATSSGSVSSNIPSTSTFLKSAVASGSNAAVAHRLGVAWMYGSSLGTY
jgi:hypothetical protein